MFSLTKWLPPLMVSALSEQDPRRVISEENFIDYT
jgi:hypothetical protein